MAEDGNAPERNDSSASPAGGAAWAVLGSADRDRANLFLDEQTTLTQKQQHLVDLQAHELKHELALRHWSLRVRHVSDVLKLGFELAVAFIVLAIAVGIAVMIWQAANADGLIIGSFAVPASLAEKGLSGQVIANKLLDRLTVMQTHTSSTRAASSFAHDWTNDIKVEIPDTGVSLGEAVRFLHGWLGHEMHLSGELYETPSGIALTVRMDNDPGQTFEAKPSDLDSVVARAAEVVFARAQPYRYEDYLSDNNRPAEALAVGRALAASGPPNETAWAEIVVASIELSKGDVAAARHSIETGLKANPQLPNLYAVQGVIDTAVGHEQQQLVDNRRGAALVRGSSTREWNPDAIASNLKADEGLVAQLQGDYALALTDNVDSPGTSADVVADANVEIALGMHDIAAARRFLAVRGAVADNLAMPGLEGEILMESGDWRGAIMKFDAAAQAFRKLAAGSKGLFSDVLPLETFVMPNEAHAYAMLGDFGRADALLKTLPVDCDSCTRVRAQVAAARKNWNATAYWLRLVSERSPDIPFADSVWGQMLLAKGDINGAISHFILAHQRGPHFADPLEMWGEALMQENRSDLALAKFEEANRYASNWGRLHLEWGKALFYAGRKGEAQKQFAIARGLDLSASEKNLLVSWISHHG
jgi:tetratricopeptide (TPR) repeat protein